MSSTFLRADLLILLTSIGVSLPSTTKISDEDLNKRLTQALDAAQQFRAVIESTTFNPSKCPKWPSEKNLPDATKRGGLLEEYQKMTSHAPNRISAEKKDTFKEMRSVVMSFAHGFQVGQREFCMTDNLIILNNWGLYVRVTQVCDINQVPVFILLYKELRPAAGESMKDAIEDLLTHSDVLVNIQTTEFERMAMAKLFRLNAKRLAEDFRPIDEKEARKHGLKPSFVLPLGPLTQREMGKLTTHTGCEVCGKKNISRCVQCLSVAYCSTECQKQDWPNHKPTCRSLKGGTWRTITFEEPSSPDFVVMNRLDTIDEVKSHGQLASVPKGVPPDIHNGKIFLVKFQISLFHFKDEAHFFLYDRQRSFQVRWWRRKEQDLFDDAEEEMGDNLKMYRWARRIGDYQLAVCLDRAPVQDPVW